MPAQTPTSFAHFVALVLASFLAAFLALSTPSGASHADPDPLTPGQRSLRILELEKEIRTSRAQLTKLIDESTSADPVPLRDHPDLRAIAARLAQIDEELALLRSNIAVSIEDGKTTVDEDPGQR